ncbi:MAG: putative membrane protein YkoI [Candidatus Azotimanducaceae bacterium]|jgi:uncharacterized membrane protein YkoI
MRTIFYLIILSCLLGSEYSHAKSNQSSLILAANESSQSKPSISKQQAVSKAKRNYPSSKVLSVKLIGSSGPAVYRLKILSSDGVVKYVFVDGNNGSVFE